MNRGIARRTLFETGRDCRYFLFRVARSVRRCELEVHALCLMTTHYHMHVRSPRAALASAMQRIQNEYVRWFNRSRRRDGTLYRGRFCSRPVRTIAYRPATVPRRCGPLLVDALLPCPVLDSRVLLPEERLRHIIAHRPELGSDARSFVAAVLADPDIVMVSDRDAGVRYCYRSYDVRGRSQLAVVNVAAPERGVLRWVVSAHLTRRRRNGVVLWQRR